MDFENSVRRVTSSWIGPIVEIDDSLFARRKANICMMVPNRAETWTLTKTLKKQLDG